MANLTFNTNVKVEVELGDRGKEVYLNHYQTLGMDEHIPGIKERLAANEGKIILPLWELMSIFGPAIQMGREVPFVRNEIRITSFNNEGPL